MNIRVCYNGPICSTWHMPKIFICGWLKSRIREREEGRAGEEGSTGHAENIFLAKVPAGFHGLVCFLTQLMHSIKISRLLLRKAGVDFPKDRLKSFILCLRRTNLML